MDAVYLYFLPFVIFTGILLVMRKTRIFGLILLLSFVTLFPLSYFLHDHFYFWKQKNSMPYLETVKSLVCDQIKTTGKLDSKITNSLYPIDGQIYIKHNNKIIYPNTYPDIQTTTHQYECESYEIYFDLSPKRKWYKSYFYYFRALTRGEVFNITDHKYWDFVLLHSAIILFWLSFVLYRISAMQDRILSSVEEVIENEF